MPNVTVKAVWMYQHPSNRNTWREYAEDIAEDIEDAWQHWVLWDGPDFIALHVKPDARVTVQFRTMQQYGEVTRHVRRFMEEQVWPEAEDAPMEHIAEEELWRHWGQVAEEQNWGQVAEEQNWEPEAEEEECSTM